MIGNTLLSVGASFLFKGEVVTVTNLTATRVYFTLPGETKPVYVNHDTFLSRAEVLATCAASTGRSSCSSPNPDSVPKSVGVDLAKEGSDQSVLVTVDSGEVVSEGAAPNAPAPKPWETEPDVKVFWAFGLKCIIARHPTYKHLCGYVRVPPGALRRRLRKYGRVLKAPLANIFGWSQATFKKSSFSKPRHKTIYDHPVLRELDAHGGLTFAGRPYSNRGPVEGLWLGFDCAHCDDLSPGMEALMASFGGPPMPSHGTYKDMAYVEASLRSLAAGLRVVSNAKR